ncbi:MULTISPECIES: SDR family oxidoreductase [unclassified Sphingomonas]|uniref:SDR family oxidoreductase n=1 Tax=unclassified Sphingomonas TaxID=196159 RepID=UPI0006F71F03|nr:MULTISPECIES: SDR family oxidoreductase [unclassified Sphingomonas]KQX18233.1 oxidoreductase [Sphingomonas sp. Root1294]KQY72718.1 oxidoreductase [Sphingomonas sp. Root50]KRB87753.1 oxidoreductase [Sphingomonas sp. Root720]
MKLDGNTILITGGGSGIGAALAHRFHDLGNQVVIAGRRLEALEAAGAGRANMAAMQLDVEDPASIAAFTRKIVADYPRLNVLINNAGIMRFEQLDRARDLADAEATIAANLMGPIRMIDGLIDHLSGQADAAIVNVTSGLAFVPLVTTATYNATKAAMHSYSVALREALRGRVEVIELVPPAVQTGLTPGQADRPGYMPLDMFVDEVMALFAQRPTPPEILVDRVKILRHAEAGQRFDQTLMQLNDFARAAREG